MWVYRMRHSDICKALLVYCHDCTALICLSLIEKESLIEYSPCLGLPCYSSIGALVITRVNFTKVAICSTFGLMSGTCETKVDFLRILVLKLQNGEFSRHTK